jgi:hypothetical protein
MVDGRANVSIEEAGRPLREESQLDHAVARIDAAVLSIAVRIELTHVDGRG